MGDYSQLAFCTEPVQQRQPLHVSQSFDVLRKSVGGHACGPLQVRVQQRSASRESGGFALCIGAAVGISYALVRTRRRYDHRCAEDKVSTWMRALIEFGVQRPSAALPAGVVAGQEPQRLDLDSEVLKRFESDGVVHIAGALRDWAPFLQEVTDDQLANPSIWSIIGKGGDVYEYLQRNMWMTNDGFRDVLYYSPLGHIFSQLGGTSEVRLSTDMLQVNPQSPLGWHQDIQNGPIDSSHALRFWLAMDSSDAKGTGVPQFLLGSHRNESVSPAATSVDPLTGDLQEFDRRSSFRVEPGDLIVWHVRTIHQLLPCETRRRAWGGTVVTEGAVYAPQGASSAISDLGGHSLEEGLPLEGPYIPRIYPTRLEEEVAPRAARALVRMSVSRIAQNLMPLVQRMLGPMLAVDREKASYLQR